MSEGTMRRAVDKMAEQIEMLFGFWTRVGRMKLRRCGLMSNCFDHLLQI